MTSPTSNRISKARRAHAELLDAKEEEENPDDEFYIQVECQARGFESPSRDSLYSAYHPEIQNPYSLP